MVAVDGGLTGSRNAASVLGGSIMQSLDWRAVARCVCCQLRTDSVNIAIDAQVSHIAMPGP